MNQNEKLSLGDLMYLAFKRTAQETAYAQWNPVRDALGAAFKVTYGDASSPEGYTNSPAYSVTDISNGLSAFTIVAQANLGQIKDLGNAGTLVEKIVTDITAHLAVPTAPYPAYAV